MLTKDFLDKWVSIIVPPEYGPNSTPEEGYPLLGVYLTPEEKFELSKERLGSDKDIFGELIDMGALMEMVGKDPSRLTGKFIIRILDCLTEESAIFTLAHEVGHLKGILEKDDQHEADDDAYADSYAFDRIKEVVEDSGLRTKIFLKALMTNGDISKDG